VKEAKKSKKMVLGVMSAVIALMMIIPTGISTVNTMRNDNSVNEAAILGFDHVKKLPFTIKKLGTTMATENMDNVLISSNSPEDDILPAITRDGNGNIAVTWTHEISALDSDVGFSYSTDNGHTWNSQIFTAEGYQYYADMGYVTGSKYEEVTGTFDGIFLICLESTASTCDFWMIPNAADPSTYEGNALVEGSAPGATYECMEDNAYYKEFSFGISGPVTFQIDDDQGMNQGWMLFWWSADFSQLVNNWDAESVLDTAPAQDPDMACIHDSDPAWTDGDFFYTVAQHNNEDTGRAEIVYKRCVPSVQDDIEFVSEQYYLDSSDMYDAAHPNVVASGDNVVVVYMTNDNVYGDWDIRCKYSSDHGQHWNTSMVAEEHPVDEMYPAAYMSGNTVFVAYISNGNLYLVKSEDGGATWGDPVQINNQDGTVVAEENAVDIHSGGIVWVDNRNGNKDIYYASLPAPLIGVKTISGGIGVKATIENTGTEDAKNVEWSIQLSGLIFIGKESTGTIDTLPAGSETTISTGLVFGIGPTTITVTANGASKKASGFVLGPLVLGVK